MILYIYKTKTEFISPGTSKVDEYCKETNEVYEYNVDC